jgi:hypothetical protein
MIDQRRQDMDEITNGTSTVKKAVSSLCLLYSRQDVNAVTRSSGTTKGFIDHHVILATPKVNILHARIATNHLVIVVSGMMGGHFDNHFVSTFNR